VFALAGDYREFVGATLAVAHLGMPKNIALNKISTLRSTIVFSVSYQSDKTQSFHSSQRTPSIP